MSLENGVPAEDRPSVSRPSPFPESEQRLYFVPYRWWKDAHDSMTSSENNESGCILYTATPGSFYAGPMKIINNIFNTDLAFNLKLEDDPTQYGGENVGISGSDFGLVSAEMWLKALKWHTDDMSDVYPLQLRLSIFRESSLFGVKISKKDNSVELFKRTCKILNMDSQMRIWDFTGQTSQYVMNERSKCSKDIQRQADLEIILKLQIYGFLDSIKGREGKKDEIGLQQNGILRSINGCSGSLPTSLSCNASGVFIGKATEAGPLGLTGLQNLGNTCFMNSAIQCLAHTPKLVDYFLGDYNKEINHDNPLGMNGAIALAFGDLIRNLWAPGATVVAPRTFKSKLARFAPQFSGFNQHDSQELLSFLLDGLHEDLNRVKSKPYVEVKDGEGRPDEEIADEYWRNHLARNDSIIVDACQGQYKSTLICPICKRVSVTFDPFMYLSLPLPPTDTRSMTVTIVNTDGSSEPSSHTVEVPKYGKCIDLIQALGTSCSLGVGESLLVAEVYNHCIIRFLEEPTDSLSLIRDRDKLIAYRMREKDESSRLVVFMHQRIEEQYVNGELSTSWKAFGIPLVGSVSDSALGSAIHKLYLDLLGPFQLSTGNNGYTSENPYSPPVIGVENNINCDEMHSEAPPSPKSVSLQNESLEFYLTDDRGNIKESKIHMNEAVPATGLSKRINVLVCLPRGQVEQYDVSLLGNLPEVFISCLFLKGPQGCVPLYKCLEAFLKEEPLGPDDMWYCPTCKKHCQASKKLDLWRLPEILVIHLKRFSYTRYTNNKLESFVDFPIENLDLSPYIANKDGQACHRYMLYAVSNHYGSLGGGHYTASVHHGAGKWFDFDDSNVSPISDERIRTAAAYVLFYRRVVE